MLVSIVKNQNVSLTPASPLRSDANSQIAIVFGYQQSKMKPQHAIVRAPMRWQALARLEDRKHRRFQARYALNDPPCLGTERDIGLRSDSIGHEQKDLPTRILRDRPGVHRDVLDVWEFVTAHEHAIEFAPDGRPAALDARHP